MEGIKKFLEKNFYVILVVFILLMFFNDCSRNRMLMDIRKDVESLKDSTYTKSELDVQLRISGLEAEKRMIQSTDRKLLDVNRQTEIDKELQKLKDE